MSRLVLGIACTIGVAYLAFADAPKKDGAVPKERASLDLAMKNHEQEVEDAKRAYQSAITKANKKLLTAYDQSISLAMKRGGGDGLDLANALNAEKKQLSTEFDTNPSSVATPSREAAIKKLLGRDWYWHWEQEDKKNPQQYTPTGGIVKGGKVIDSKWSMDLMWVVKQDSHYLVFVDDKRLRGFHIPSGRPVGMFTDGGK